MLENDLIQMLNLQGYHITRSELKGTQFHLWVEPDVLSFLCPHCGMRLNAIHSRWEIELKERPVLGHHTLIHIPRYRVRCACQTKPLRVEIAIQEPGFRITRALAKAVVDDARDVTLKFVATRYGLSWATVRDIDLADLKRQVAALELVAPNSIGVDEVSYRKGHKYLTVVTDQHSRRIIFVTKGRKSANLNEFFESRIDPLAKKRLEAASIDMWDPYEKSIRQHAPQATIVYDRFHLMRKLNTCLDEVRRQAQKNLEDEPRKLFKHQRFLFLRGEEKLKPQDQQTLNELLEMNKPLQAAYLLKEQFRQLYQLEPEPGESPSQTYQKAFRFLIGWLQRADQSRLKPFKTFAKAVKRRWVGILSYFLYPISNGICEGLNNKIASLKKRAYGFRDLEYFMLKIYQQGNFI
ncbi:MAG: ISL3 family transposase [Planctomycetota bacterium]|jgi:transposase